MKTTMSRVLLLLTLVLISIGPNAHAFYNPTAGVWIRRAEDGTRLGANAYADQSTDRGALAIGTANVGPTQPVPGLDIFDGVQIDPQQLAGNCGKISWTVWWVITNPIYNTLGGVVVQDITISWDVKSCDGTKKKVEADEKWTSPLHYWESWPVSRGSGGRSADFSDTFWWGDEGCCKGKVTWEGKAQFFHGLSEQDLVNKGWTKNNPATGAGTLLSSQNNPNLSGGSNTKNHKMTIEWNCCPGSLDKRTRVTSREPAATTSQ